MMQYLIYDQTPLFRDITAVAKGSRLDAGYNKGANAPNPFFVEFLHESMDIYQCVRLATSTLLQSFPEYCLLTRNSTREHRMQKEEYSSNLAQQRLERSQVLLSIEARLGALNDQRERLTKSSASVGLFSMFKDKGINPSMDLLAFADGCLQCLNQRFSLLSMLAIKIEAIRRERELVLNKFPLWSSRFSARAPEKKTFDDYHEKMETSMHTQDDASPTIDVDPKILENEAKQLFQSTSIVLHTSELSALEEASSSVQALRELQSILSLHIESQSGVITTLYDDAILSYDHVKRGHEYLKRASADPQGPFRLASMFLIVLTIAIMFLDWFD